ncbi:hypothetical protein GUJ93_ZPchr0005g14470 [Zizania palustris]|uniref:Uncharacterized protein n=1 Tax=Zizania palustris TaxID=103762 RepID=A0A8J5SM45_ZIZPA|nr:hypothetical protein GUJ93_ZPchr0005g14470 [Zizania palustris]
MSSLLSPPAVPSLMVARDAAVGAGGGGGGVASGGSYGPTIAALVIIAILTAASVAFGQFCVGWRRRRATYVRCGAHSIGAFVRLTRAGSCGCGGGGGGGAGASAGGAACYDVALPVKKSEKKGGDIESGAAAVEEVDGSDAPKVEEDDDVAASKASA